MAPSPPSIKLAGSIDKILSESSLLVLIYSGTEYSLVQTYYFSGASMPFAGQAVVERNLPFTCLMSNYLSSKEGAMQGLVQHPFAPNLDAELRKSGGDVDEVGE